MDRKFLIKVFLLFTLLFHYSLMNGQTLKQTIKGTVSDRISMESLPGTVIAIVDIDPVLTTVTDLDGNFKIENVPVGSHTIKVQFVGYKEITLQNVEINSGKERFLTIQLDEEISEMKEVVIKGNFEKDKPINEMSIVSTKTFSVEETRKYAAAVNDPARMATSFSGVVSTDDGNNAISIRGNSPNGLQWRMEGLEIPNPNHFSAAGSSGGGISMISSQLLTNSDFLTGAFASEYGNALSGVFDLRLRRGNNERREHTFQAGVMGLDFATEGPFSKKYKGSYLINYRYSTLTIIQKFIKITDASTDFQDLSYNIFLPAGKAGSFTIYGINGISDQELEAKKDSALWKENISNKYNNNYISNTSATGVTHTIRTGENSYLKSSVGIALTKNVDNFDTLNNKYEMIRLYDNDYKQKRFTVQSIFTSKVNRRLNYRTGIIADMSSFDLSEKVRIDSTGQMREIINNKGNSQLLHAFAQFNYNVTEKLSVHAGLHSLFLFLNNTYSIEPRTAVRYAIDAKQSIALAYGLHGQTQPIGVYFYQNEAGNLVNKNLKISQSHHNVLSYDRNIDSYTRVKAEVYHQYLFNIPIAMDPSSTYSVLNLRDGFTDMQLTNEGKGRNYGAELMIERFLHKDFYCLLSGSLFESKYQAANKKWYDTRYNTNYNLTFTAGKEWRSANEKRIFGLNIKTIYVGGLRETPLDLEKTVATGTVSYHESLAFTKENPFYFRTDFRISLKNNYKKSSGTLALDLQNATNRKNIGGSYYDSNTLSIKYWYQTPFIPVLSYRLEF